MNEEEVLEIFYTKFDKMITLTLRKRIFLAIYLPPGLPPFPFLGTKSLLFLNRI